MDNAPQPENFSNFDEFNAVYQEWLENYDDEAQEYCFDSAQYIWEQYQEEINNEY